MRHSLLVLSLVIATACGGGGSSGGGAPAKTEGDIGPAGGTLTSTSGATSGASVVVPPNALTAILKFVIDSGTDISGGPGTTKIGPPVRFAPAGTNFAFDATVTVPFTPSNVPAGRQVLVAQADSGGTVTIHNAPTVDLAMGRASVDVSSFSTFQAFIAPATPTFDATGSWVFMLSNGFSTPSGDEDPDGAFGLAVVTQDGSDVTVEIDGDTFTGTVSGSDYSVSGTFTDDGETCTDTVSFSLTDIDNGTGTVAFSCTDSSGTVTGGADLTLSRQMAPLFGADGTWTVTTSNNFSIPAGDEDPDEVFPVMIVQTGLEFTLEMEGMIYPGFVSGDRYYVSWLEPEDDGESDVFVEFTLATPDSGSGTVRWKFWGDDGNNVDGGGDLSLSRDG